MTTTTPVERPHVTADRSSIGEPGSRWRIATPAAVIDLDALDRNLARMADRAGSAGVSLRPHAKSHKSAFIARRQLDAGAVGVCCATVAEAEALVAHGIDDILVTSPTAGHGTARRIAALAARSRLTVAVDHPDAVGELHAAADAIDAGQDAGLDVVLDIDVGLGRTGVASVEAARALARAIHDDSLVHLAGVQAYGGHWQHVAGIEERHRQVADGMARLSQVVDALERDGHDLPIRTGGGTGTISADLSLGVLNELQPGSYAFMDQQYADALGDDSDGAFEQSLLVQATVISVNQPGWVTTDSGLKAFSTDAGDPRPVGEGLDETAFRFFGDEHGLLVRPAGRPLERGDRVQLRPPHCDPTIDRYDVLHIVSGDVLVDIVAVDARGASQ